MTATSTGMTRMESFPFDSMADGYDTDGYPVYDRAVGSSMLRATFQEFFSNGVFPTPGNALQIAKGANGLTVTIQPGIAIINGAMGGIEGTDPLTLTLDTASPQGNVCYAIMLRFDATEEMRSLYFNVVRSDASTTPTPPEPDTTTPLVYELRLGYVTVPSNATDLSEATVTNEKGLAVCPFAAPFEEIDMSGVTADAQASAQAALTALMQFIDTNKALVQSALDDTTAGNLQNQITALQEQLSNLNFSTMVDNVTIEYTQELGDPSKLLRVKDGGIGTNQIADGAITPEKIAPPVAPVLPSDLSSATWSQLKEISEWQDYDAASLKQYVGQSKTASMAGYGDVTFRCIGVRHDDKSDGTGKAGFTFDCESVLFSDVASNQTDEYVWPETTLREILAGLFTTFQTDLSSSICEVMKTYNIASGSSKYGISNDKIFAISIYEIFSSGPSTSYYDGSTVYQYYSENNNAQSRMKALLGSPGSYQSWWTRSNEYTTMFIVNTSGSYAGFSITSQCGYSPAFCI